LRGWPVVHPRNSALAVGGPVLLKKRLRLCSARPLADSQRAGIVDSPPCVKRCNAWRQSEANQSAVPAELVIDHSCKWTILERQCFGLKRIGISRNVERYAFLRWGQTAFQNFKVVPPDTVFATK